VFRHSEKSWMLRCLSGGAVLVAVPFVPHFILRE
jgi:hypothetical protein